MRPLGPVDRLGQGKLIVTYEGDAPPAIGTEAIDETLAPVGTVVDVIGPVAAPLLVVDPADDVDAPAHLGTRVYVRDG